MPFNIVPFVQDEEAMEYLKEVGPDTMIPCFSVNRKENKNVEKCNEINLALFQDLAHTSSEQTAHRIPMIVTSSSLVPHKHSVAVKNFKERLGVSGSRFTKLCIYRPRVIQKLFPAV